MDLGFVGVFRCWPAVALLPVVFWMFKRRMDVEEEFMIRRFGEDYRAYMVRTARLVPGVRWYRARGPAGAARRRRTLD